MAPNHAVQAPIIERPGTPLRTPHRTYRLEFLMRLRAASLLRRPRRLQPRTSTPTASGTVTKSTNIVNSSGTATKSTNIVNSSGTATKSTEPASSPTAKKDELYDRAATSFLTRVCASEAALRSEIRAPQFARIVSQPKSLQQSQWFQVKNAVEEALRITLVRYESQRRERYTSITREFIVSLLRDKPCDPDNLIRRLQQKGYIDASGCIKHDMVSRAPHGEAMLFACVAIARDGRLLDHVADARVYDAIAAAVLKKLWSLLATWLPDEEDERLRGISDGRRQSYTPPSGRYTCDKRGFSFTDDDDDGDDDGDDDDDYDSSEDSLSDSSDCSSDESD